MDLHAFTSITQLREALDQKKITPQEVVAFYLKRLETFDGEIGSTLEIFNEASIVKEMSSTGKLFGIPGIIKNNICIKDRLTTCASKILENYRATNDATAITRLKNAGAPLIATANLDEFAMGSSTETSYFKKTKNPWDISRVPGGSSGGSSAAVAAGFAPWALGTDTGGSVRQPAAFCGIVGLKPTYGLVSRYGLVAYASSLDQIGVMTRSVYDNALVLSVIAGKDERDSSTLPIEPKDYTQTLDGTIPNGLKIGIVDNTLGAEGMDQEVVSSIETALKELEKLGATIHHVTLPSIEYSAAAYFILSRAEASSNLARYDGVRYGFRDMKADTLTSMYEDTRHDGFGAEVKKRIMVGNYVLSSGHLGEFYENAKQVKRLIRSQFIQAFKEVDILLMPSQPAPAFKLGAFDLDPLKMDLQDYFTCPMNLAGVPSISIPCGMSSKNMPIGMQLIGPHCAEELLYRVGHAYEQQTPWHTMHPKL